MEKKNLKTKLNHNQRKRCRFYSENKLKERQTKTLLYAFLTKEKPKAST